MRIDILSAVPELLDGPFAHSIMKRAQQRGLLEVHVHGLRKWGQGKHVSIDDTQFGGGAGMVMACEPIFLAYEELSAERTYDEFIFMTPDAKPLTQNVVNELSLKGNLLILCGHYKGVDERIRERYITREISIGDFVLSGGELPAAVLVDAIGRIIPGVLNDATSALTDSFQDGLLSAPVYTRPAEWRGLKVPDILLSGHEANINAWREEQAYQRTKDRRPDLLE
jgi:tRNA (guanine37-N1)-methyltransferase